MHALLDKLRKTAARELDVLGIGECSLDRVYPLRGRLRDFVGKKGVAERVLPLGGGQVATAMCALRRLGFRTAFVGAIGDDDDGSAVLSGLRDEGVHTREVRVVAGAATRTALLFVDEDGERTVIEHRDAALHLGKDDPPPKTLAAARVVHVDGTYPSAALRAARLARASGGLVSIDLDTPSASMLELLRLSDLTVLPIDFVTALTGETDVERGARRVAEHTSGQVIVTLGSAGCAALFFDASGARLLRQAAYRPPGGIVDTTACGDTFRAALIARLLDRVTAAADALQSPEDELAAALRFASAAASLKCQAPGRQGCPTRPAVDEFLKRLQTEQTS